MAAELYKIGAVSKLTGVSVECLRAWERRYGMDPAERAGKTRFYSAAQVEWLKRIKMLIDRGHPISQLINLGDAELDQRLRLERAATSIPAPRSSLQVGLIGGGLMLLEREYDGPREIDVHGRWASHESFEAQSQALPEIGLVVVEMPSLDTQLIDNFTNVFGQGLVVVYRYATDADLAIASQLDVSLIQWPVTWDDIEQACLTQARPLRTIGTSRRFTEEELVHLASMSNTGDCTCPKDLVRLIGDVNAYAIHAERCGGGEDREMHVAMAADAHAARARLEDALQTLASRHGLLQQAN